MCYRFVLHAVIVYMCIFRCVCSLLVNVVNHIDSLIEEWYPGLVAVDKYGDPLVRRLAPCGHCKGKIVDGLFRS